MSGNKCLKKGCDKTTEEDSNYCFDHQPGKSPGKTVLKLDRGQSEDRGSGARDGRGGAGGPKPPPK